MSKADNLVPCPRLGSAGNAPWSVWKGRHSCPPRGHPKGAPGRGFGTRPNGGSCNSCSEPPFRAVCSQCFPPSRLAQFSPPLCFLPPPVHRHCPLRPPELQPNAGALVGNGPLLLKVSPVLRWRSWHLGAFPRFCAGFYHPPAPHTLAPLFPLCRVLFGPLSPVTSNAASR